MLINYISKLVKYKALLTLSLMLFLQSCATETQPTEEEPPVKIAVLLPLSGPKREESSALAEMIRQGVYDALRVRADLHFYDVSNETLAKDSMARVVASGTKIILGPATSEATQLIAPIAEKNDIDVISLSNNPALISKNIFVFGHQPMKQTEILLDNFLRHNYRHFITLTPQGNYYKSVSDVIKDDVISHNGTFVGAYHYGADPESIAKSVQFISKLVDNLNEDPENENKPVIYISGLDKNLHLLYNAIIAANLDKKAVICGDNGIDIDYPGDITLYFPASNNIVASGLHDKAYKLLGRRYLSAFEILAYDAGYITATSLQEQYSAATFRRRLKSSSGFIGLSGVTYLGSQLAERNYDIIKREHNKYQKAFDIIASGK